ncbi:discoidin domain-containing protein [Promicromonospora kroppenstedtii]|uniref:discoidin domain-containing protein n=1 Tax=Promicromonospora kroppenstedtii TaxID=440482 RepID=UPI0004AE2404|nr:discoidin domain-containing protein [Promicromonospora kroppenstedtii]
MRATRLSLAAALVTALLLTLAGPAPAQAQEDPVLISQGRPAVASSLEKPEFPARQAVDGNPNTRWSSAFSDPQWLRIDLGRVTTVNRVEIDWEVSYATDYRIELSTDGESWETHWVGAGDGGNDVMNILGEARYVRMYSGARSGTAGNSIWEMRVYGAPEPTPTPTPTKPKPKPQVSVTPRAVVSPTPTPTPTPTPVPSRSGPPGSVLYYVVRETPDGTFEKLNDISERFLGDRERWPEIAALTEGHRQPDGEYLTDPRTLTPGWVLRMPKDAQGKGLKFGPLPGYEGPSPSPSAAPSLEPSPTPTDEVAGTAERAAVVVPWPVILPVAGGVLVIGLLGLLVAWLLKRRKQAEPFDDSLLRTDTSAAWTVDRALRVLMAACERDGLEVPGTTGVFIEGSSMRLRLTNPASPAPEPWQVSEDGQSWSAPLAKLQSGAASESPTNRFARLVNLGMGETGRVLVDFSVARGVISLDGPTRVRHEVLRRWLGELTGNPWSDDPRVVMVGNGLPRPEQVEHLSGIEQVLPELEVGDGGVLVLSQAPSTAQQDLLAARFASPEFTWVVIVLGQSPSAKWRFTAGDDGWLRSGFLPDVRFDEQTAVRRGGE